MFTLLGGPNALIEKRKKKKERQTTTFVFILDTRHDQQAAPSVSFCWRNAFHLSPPPLSFGHDLFALIRVRFQRGFVANVIIYKFLKYMSVTNKKSNEKWGFVD